MSSSSAWVILLAAATVVDGVLAGASLDQSIKQLPARHRLGMRAFSAYSQAPDQANGLVWYAVLGIGSALLTIATLVPSWNGVTNETTQLRGKSTKPIGSPGSKSTVSTSRNTELSDRRSR
jgi:hypothetical protein